jgi:hypothetical protein
MRVHLGRKIGMLVQSLINMLLAEREIKLTVEQRAELIDLAKKPDIHLPELLTILRGTQRTHN